MSEDAIAITPLELLERSTGELIDRSESLPALGGRASQVAIRQAVNLTAAAVGGAEELFAFADVVASNGLPAVKLLWLASGATVSERTAGAFVGLEYLRIDSSRPVSLKWFHRSPLRGLALADRALGDWNRMVNSGMPLDDNKKLQHLAVDCRMSGELPRLGELNIRSLTVRSRERPKQMKEIWGLRSLTRLQLLGVPLTDLRAAHNLMDLTDLRLVTPKSFTGISHLKTLRSLLVYGRTCPPVRELAQASELRELELRVETLPADVAALGDCETLECLRLELGNITSTVQLDLEFLGRLKRLKSLALCGISLDRKDLRFLEGLKCLEEFILTGNLGGLTEGEIARYLSPARITIKDMSKGTELTPQRIAEEWTIFQDLTSVLGVKDNYEAEMMIRNEVSRSEPDVLAKLEFDSEAGAVSVASKDRGAIEAVVRVVGRLKRIKAG